MKPLTSYWRGTKFRSRTEARWACYFDAMEIEWEYESEGAALPSGPYLPDFWLPDLVAWAEVKSQLGFSDIERKKCEELCEATGFRVFLLPGPPKLQTYEMLVTPGVYGPDDAGVTSMKVGLWGKWLAKEGEPCYEPTYHYDQDAEIAITRVKESDFAQRDAAPLGWTGIEPVV